MERISEERSPNEDGIWKLPSAENQCQEPGTLHPRGKSDKEGHGAAP